MKSFAVLVPESSHLCPDEVKADSLEALHSKERRYVHIITAALADLGGGQGVLTSPFLPPQKLDRSTHFSYTLSYCFQFSSTSTKYISRQSFFFGGGASIGFTSYFYVVRSSGSRGGSRGCGTPLLAQRFFSLNDPKSLN